MICLVLTFSVYFSESRDDVHYIGKGAFFFEDSFYRQDTFTSLGSRENSFLEDGQKAPVATKFYQNQKAPILTKFMQDKKSTALSSHY